MLSCRILKDVSGVNAFTDTSDVSWFQGDTVTIYFQLIDPTLDTQREGFSNPGRRFCAATGATLSVLIDSIDSAKKVTKVASLAFPNQDSSVWKIQIVASDDILGTANFRLTLTEGGIITRGLAKNVVKVYSNTNTQYQ